MIEALGVQLIVSVLATFVAATVTTDAQAPEDIADVPKVAVPLAIVCVIVADADGKVYVDESVPARVIVLLTVSVFEVVPPATLNPVEFGIRLTLLRLVELERAAGNSAAVIELQVGEAESEMALTN